MFQSHNFFQLVGLRKCEQERVHSASFLHIILPYTPHCIVRLILSVPCSIFDKVFHKVNVPAYLYCLEIIIVHFKICENEDNFGKVLEHSIVGFGDFIPCHNINVMAGQKGSYRRLASGLTLSTVTCSLSFILTSVSDFVSCVHCLSCCHFTKYFATNHLYPLH